MPTHPSTPLPVTFARHGPLLFLASQTWVDVRAVDYVRFLEDRQGVEWLTVQLRSGAIECPGRLSTVVGAIATAVNDWERERAYEQELGRLMALDSGAVPAGETPPAEWDVDRPFG